MSEICLFVFVSVLARTLHLYLYNLMQPPPPGGGGGDKLKVSFQNFSFQTGEFTCIAANTGGRIQETVQVRVVRSPHIEPLLNLTLEQGQASSRATHHLGH